MDVAAYGLQTAIVVMHLSRTGINSNELSIIMAIQVLLLWIKVQYYARYLPRNAPCSSMLSKIDTLLHSLRGLSQVPGFCGQACSR